jgi:hypothetical protein
VDRFFDAIENCDSHLVTELLAADPSLANATESPASAGMILQNPQCLQQLRRYAVNRRTPRGIHRRGICPGRQQDFYKTAIDLLSGHKLSREILQKAMDRKRAST